MLTSDYDDSPDTPGVYLGIDTAGDYFYPAICSFVDQPPKVFLIKDAETGLETLKREDLRSIITGGVVSDCTILALKSTSVGI
jgi:hypothetical protein